VNCIYTNNLKPI